MSDSDDENIVRYGTQLEPYEEDCTRAMPKTINRGNATQRRYRKLLSANVNVHKARELRHLPWTEICKIIPGIDLMVSENANPPKKSKKKHDLRLKLIQAHQLMEHRSREEPDQAAFWNNPSDAHQTARNRSRSPIYWGPTQYNEQSRHSNKDEITHGSNPHQSYRSPQTYTEEVSYTSQLNNYLDQAGPSQSRCYEIHRRKRHPSESEPIWEPPYKVTKDMQVDCEGGSNYRERECSPRTRARHDPIPMACSSKHSFERTQLNYIDLDEAMEVKVRNGMRAVKRHYNESNDGNPFSEQSYKVQNPSSEGGASFNYWSEPDRPSRLGLRNETHPPKQASYSYTEDKKFREDPKNYQKISWENNVNIDYRESDRPSRDGLRSQSHPMVICIDNSDEECNSGPIYQSRTLVDTDGVQFNYSEAYQSEPRSIKGSCKTQTSETREAFEDKDANDDKNAEPIRVGIRNIAPMSKKQMTLVHQAINQAIVEIGVQGAGPKFSGSIFRTGSIVMICQNHKSRTWLEKTVPKLKPWPEAWLSVTPHGEVPKTIIASILIPDKEGITVDTALELLRVQNPGLHTDHWRVFKVTKIYSGQIAHLSIDVASFESLRLLNFKANLGIDKVSFRIKSGPGPRGRKVKPSEDIPLSPALCTEKQNEDSNSCAVESNSMKIGKNRRRQLNKKARQVQSQTIDTKPNKMTHVKKSKSPSSETWHHNVDQSYYSSDWVTW